MISYCLKNIVGLEKHLSHFGIYFTVLLSVDYSEGSKCYQTLREEFQLSVFCKYFIDADYHHEEFISNSQSCYVLKYEPIFKDEHSNLQIKMSLLCFACPIQFEDIDQLCKHIQNVHKIRGPNSYQCKLCNTVLGTMDTYKRHLKKCSQKTRQTRQTNKVWLSR